MSDPISPAKIFVILPAYNESENLPALLEKFASLNDAQIIVVDDGSADGTIAAAEKFQKRINLIVEKHPKNLGLGAALRTGLKKALSIAGDDDWIVTMDADNSHPPELIPQMIQKLRSTNSDVVIASRYADGGKEIGLAAHRKFLSWACSGILKLFFNVPGVKDYTCGYRLMKASALKKVAEKTNGEFVTETGFVCMSELLLNLAGVGAKFAESPLVLRYDLKRGQSKMKIFRTIGGYFRLILKRK